MASESKTWEEAEDAKRSAQPWTISRPATQMAGPSRPLSVASKLQPGELPALSPKQGYIPTQAMENPQTGLQYRADMGSATRVAYGFTQGPQGGLMPNEDPNTGMYSSAADTVGYACGGTAVRLETADAGTIHYRAQRYQVTQVTATPHTVTYADYLLLVDTSTTAITVNLPAALEGLTYIIKDQSGNAAVKNITISPAAGTIDGAGSKVISTNYVSYTVVCDGANWFIV